MKNLLGMESWVGHNNKHCLNGLKSINLVAFEQFILC